MSREDKTEAVLTELVRLGEIASGILDGEEVKHIISTEAMHYIVNPDPDHRYLAGDYYDVEGELFLRTKKLLLRVERLGQVPVDSSVWVPVPVSPPAVTVAVHNGVNHRYYTFGQETLPTPEAMRQVFESGTIGRIGPDEGEQKARMATALAPVRDSLGDVVGIAEFTSLLDGEPEAWS